MNICIVTQQYKNVISGVGLHANNLTTALLSEGHTITLMLPEDQAPQFESPQLTVVTVKKPSFNQNQARWLSLSRLFNAALKKLESTNKFDLIHFTDVRESFFCTSRTPMIGHINDTYSAELASPLYYKKHYPDWLFRWLYYSAVHFLESIKLQRVKILVANSDFTANTIKKAYPSVASKVRVCYKSVDVERYHEVYESRKAAPPDPNQQTILFVGSNMYRKGVADLIKAAPGVVEEFPQVRFILVGQDKSIDRLKEMCTALNVESNFDFLGWQSQESLLPRYKQASVFVMPSLTEALGVTFLEAMAAGVPVIGTAVGGIPEIIEGGVNGLLVPVESPHLICGAIKRLLSDSDLRQELTLNAYNSLAKFDVSRMMACTQKLYQEALNEEDSKLKGAMS